MFLSHLTDVNELTALRFFRLRLGGVDCDADGLRVGDVPLVERDALGKWARRDTGDLNRALAKIYGLPLDIGAKRQGLDAVAAALANGDIARAQVAALLLRLPDPPAPGATDQRHRTRELAACGLLKAEDGWDEQHPRTGTAPNPGWFAPKDTGSDADAKRDAPDGEHAFTAPALAPPRCWLRACQRARWKG